MDGHDCRRVIYRGRVQGVGFRMTAARIARQFPVGGTVRNCSDGSVELIATGTAQAIDDYLAALRSVMRGNIDDEASSPAPAVGVPTDAVRIVG